MTIGFGIEYKHIKYFQKFKFIVTAVDSDEHLVSIINQEPKFMIEEPKETNYKFIVIAFNDKGDSKVIEINKDSIVDASIGKLCE